MFTSPLITARRGGVQGSVMTPSMSSSSFVVFPAGETKRCWSPPPQSQMFRKWPWTAGYETFCSWSENGVRMLLDRGGPVGIVQAAVKAVPKARRTVRDCCMVGEKGVRFKLVARVIMSPFSSP